MPKKAKDRTGPDFQTLFVQWMKNVQAEVEVALHKAHDDMKCYTDRSHADTPKYQVGDGVWDLSQKWCHFYFWVCRRDHMVCVQPQGINFLLVILQAHPHFSY